MVCEFGTNVVVCGPPRGVYRRAELHCHECAEKHPFVKRWDGAWYGTTLYGACGDRWQDGYRFPRPFQRYWRRDAQAKFQAMWDHAAPVDLYEAYTRADVDMACGDDDSLNDAIERRQAAHEAIRARAALDTKEAQR